MFVKPLQPRRTEGPHHAASPLELFYDLATVIAIAAAATGLHHAIADGETALGTLRFLTIFFAVWLSWMNFTWFASAYGHEDAGYIISVFVLVFGTAVLASGVGNYIETGENLTGFIGWAIQRAALVGLWVRAALGDAGRRRTALTYAAGLAGLQTLWAGVFLLAPTDMRFGLSTPLVLMELALPILAGRTPWHRGHIVERHGLLTLIVLGEGIVAVGMILAASFDHGTFTWETVPTAIAATLIVCTMWWLYFAEEDHAALGRNGTALI